MKRILIISLFIGCGGPASVGSGVNTTFNENAPAWAKKGDRVSGSDHQFVCEGEGKNEKDAMQSAQSICDDKICKLCGVEIESVVQTRETLTGIEVERKVQERCRRIRVGDNKLSRKMVDCGPEGCTAWVLIDYSEAQRDRECKNLTDENYASPEECTRLIEEFKSVPGHTAASFRKRAELIESAIGACAEIDVRPTPLMQSLEEKLKIGMSHYRKGAPKYLRKYWIQDHPPMWAEYKQSPSFSQRLKILWSYLSQKPPLLEVIEHTYIDKKAFDTPEALARLFEKMKKAPKDEAYGTRDIHMIPVTRIGSMLGRDHYTQDLSELNKWIRKEYPADKIKSWGHIINIAHLFAADHVIDQEEWDWAVKLPSWRNRISLELLKTKQHSGKSQVERAMEALDFMRENKRRSTLPRALTGVIPRKQPKLFLSVLERLSAQEQAEVPWKTYVHFLGSESARDRYEIPAKFLPQMESVIIRTKYDLKACKALPRRFEFLENQGRDLKKFNEIICKCLTTYREKRSPYKGAYNRDLYGRAVREGLKCVQLR